MRSGKWRVGLVLLLGAGVVLANVRAPVFAVRQAGYDGPVAWAQGETRVRQTWRSHYPGLAAVIVQPAEPWPPDDQVVTLRLWELAPVEVERVRLSRPIGEWRVGSHLRFVFAPLDDSAGKTYALEIETTADQPLRLVGTRLDLYSGGEMTGGGDLTFEARFDGRLGPTLAALLGRLSEGRPGMWGQPWPYVGLALLYLLTLGAATAALWRQAFAGAADRPARSVPPEQRL